MVSLFAILLVSVSFHLRTELLVGKNTCSKIACQVALALGKEEPTKYTGHAFRVSSATALADAGKLLHLLHSSSFSELVNTEL
jgi:hypothetical protein